MQKLFHNVVYLLILAMSCLTTAQASDVDKKNPYKMIKGVAEITFKRFADEHDAIRKNPNLLKDIVSDELMPYINFKYAAGKVLGTQFKKTTKAERAEFVPVFRDYLITSYAQVFTLYNKNKQKVTYEPENKLANERITKQKILTVKTQVMESGRDPIHIGFKVRKDKKTKEWKAFDMVAEGVSLLDSKKAELGGLIRQKGLGHVTKLLKEKSSRNIVFKERKSH
jgi:phospholipid transport system substrate-binding protein